MKEKPAKQLSRQGFLRNVILGFAALAVIIGTAFYMGQDTSMADIDYAAASLQTSQAGKGTIKTEYSFDKFVVNTKDAASEEGAVLGQISSLYDKMKVNADMRYDLEKDQYEVSAVITIGDSKFLSGTVYLDKEGVYVTLPELYEKTIYASYDALSAMSDDEMNLKALVEAFCGIEDIAEVKNFDTSEYLNLMREHTTTEEMGNGEVVIGDDKVSGRKVKVAYKDEQAFAEQFCEYISDNDKIASMLNAVGKSFVPALQANKSVLNLTDSDIKEVEQLGTNFNKVMKESGTQKKIQDSYNQANSEVSTQQENYSIINGDRIVGAISNVSVDDDEMSIQMNLKAIVDSKVEYTTDLNKSNMFVLTGSNDSEFEAVSQQMSLALVGVVLSNAELMGIMQNSMQ